MDSSKFSVAICVYGKDNPEHFDVAMESVVKQTLSPAEYIITTKQYRDIDELRRNPPFADFYINGSDQVFGLRGEFDKERMLQFGEKTVKRYSFSASLGEYDWTAEEKTQFAKMLEKLWLKERMED